MKHILNNISEEEKNAIREQHTGGMKLNIEKFKQLLETKQGDVKPLVAEQIQDRIVPSGPSPSAKPKVVKDKITSPSSTTKPTSPSPMTSSRPTTGTQIQPIQIKIGDFLVNLTTMKKTGQGSTFYGQIRGDKEYQEVLFSCGSGKVAMKKLGDNTVKFIDSQISPEGLKLLNKAAGCDSYVKNQGTSSAMV